MCRYAFHHYKPHYVCFDCRKTFKQALLEDMIIQNGDWDRYQQLYIHPHQSWNFKYSSKEEIQAQEKDWLAYFEERYFNKKSRCPHCGNAMYPIGLDFKAPKKEKIKEWEMVRGMYTLGNTFHTCGCEGPG